MIFLLLVACLCFVYILHLTIKLANKGAHTEDHCNFVILVVQYKKTAVYYFLVAAES